MQALVLAGGEGTRLRPLTLTRPKPALPLVGRPFICFMLDWLARHGVTEAIVASGFLAADVQRALDGWVRDELEVRYLEETEPLGTAGPLRLAADAGMLDDRFLVLNGDVLTDLDLTAHLAAHAERGALASLALYPVSDPTSYGLVRRGEDGAVRGFLEKPDPAEVDTDEVNAGAYVLERSVLDLIPVGRAVSIEREVFPRLVGQGLYGLRLEGYWMDIGTPERYLQASWDILERRVETALAGDVDERGLALDEHAEVDPGAAVAGPALIASGARVASGATVGPRAVLGDHCELDEGALVRGSVLHAGCTVGVGASVQGAILASGVSVGPGATVPAGAVVGEEARIEAGATLDADARLEPGGVAA